MQSALSVGLFSGYKCALLDVERGKLHHKREHDVSVNALLEAEAESFIKIWNSLEAQSA